MVIHSITILDHKNNTRTYEVDGFAPGGFDIEKINVYAFGDFILEDDLLHIAAAKARAVKISGPLESTSLINPTIVSITYS